MEAIAAIGLSNRRRRTMSNLIAGGGGRKSNLPDELSSSYQKLISSSAPCMIVANMVEGIVCQVRDWQRTIETDWEIGRSYMTVFDSMHGIFEICQSERE